MCAPGEKATVREGDNEDWAPAKRVILPQLLTPVAEVLTGARRYLALLNSTS